MGRVLDSEIQIMWTVLLHTMDLIILGYVFPLAA
jgi:hypothetical protein